MNIHQGYANLWFENNIKNIKRSFSRVYLIISSCFSESGKMFSLIHRAHRRRRYERSSSWNHTEENAVNIEAITPPSTPERPKLEGFHFCASNKRLSSSLNEPKKNKPTRQLSMPTTLEPKNDEHLNDIFKETTKTQNGEDACSTSIAQPN